MTQTIDSPVWASCPVCSQDTRHTVRSQFITTISPEVYSPGATSSEQLLFNWTALQILECRGCGQPSFRQGWSATPQLSESWGWRIVHAGTARIREPSGAGNCLPINVAKLQRETRLAFECGAHTLAAVGLRAAVEAVVSDRHCKGENLRKKISKLGGVLSAGDIHLLQTHRSLGNAAAHAMQTPSEDELAAALDVLDHLLKTLYELPRRAEDLKRLRAARLGGQSAGLPDAC
jgi:hypothetical protein